MWGIEKDEEFDNKLGDKLTYQDSCENRPPQIRDWTELIEQRVQSTWLKFGEGLNPFSILCSVLCVFTLARLMITHICFSGVTFSPMGAFRPVPFPLTLSVRLQN